jgi:hypothetical protein
MSNAIIGALRVVLGMDSAAFDKGATAAQKRMKAMERSLGRTSRRMKAIGQRMSVAITGPIIGIAYKSVAAQKEQEQAIAAVDAALNSMGDGAGYTSDQLQKMASKMQSKSLYGDEAILKKVTANLLTFGNVQGEVFERGQQLALDLSARLGTDLQSSAVMLGKALNDPAAGLTALTRVGVTFTEQQKEQIKAMTQAGNVAGAQSLMLDELERQYRGQAAALAGTDSGKITQAWNSIGDAMERVGAVILPIAAQYAEKIKELAERFQNLSPETQELIVKIGLLAAVVGPIVLAFGAFLGAVAPIAVAIGAILSPIGLAVAAIGALGFVIWRNWEDIKAWGANIASKFSEVAFAIRDAFKGSVGAVVVAIKEVWNGIWGEVSTWPAKMLALGKDLITSLWAGITGQNAKSKQMAAQVGRDFGKGMAAGLSGSKQTVGDAMTDMSDYIDKVARDENEIKSPSRRYMRIGQMLMQGLGLGVSGGVQEVSEKMRAASKDIAAQMNGGSAGADGLDGFGGGVKKLGAVSDDVFSRMGSWLVDLKSGATSLKETLSGLLSNWSNSLGQSGMSGLSSFLTGSLGKVGGGLLSGIAGSLMGFANGGEFGVGGTGGIDSQLVAFRASPDETVSITKPGQELSSGGGGVTELIVRADEGAVVELVRNEAGVMIQQAAPGIISSAKQATFTRMAKTKRGI